MALSDLEKWLLLIFEQPKNDEMEIVINGERFLLKNVTTKIGSSSADDVTEVTLRFDEEAFKKATTSPSSLGSEELLARFARAVPMEYPAMCSDEECGWIGMARGPTRRKCPDCGKPVLSRAKKPDQQAEPGARGGPITVSNPARAPGQRSPIEYENYTAEAADERED